MGKKDKTPRNKAVPAGKSPRIGLDPDDANRQTPVWSICRFDHDGPWGQGSFANSDVLWGTIYPAMKSYETMTWNEILQNRKYNHSVPAIRLITEAQHRLVALRLDDYEEVFRFRVGGTGRVWGIRDGRVFLILWWDPDHLICPSTID